MIESSLRTLLVPAIGTAALTEPSLLAAGEAAIALPAITVGTQKKQRAAFYGNTKTLPQNHFAMRRHACSQAELDNGTGSVAG